MFKKQSFYYTGNILFLILVIYFALANSYGPKEMKIVSKLFADVCLFLQSICGFLQVYFVAKVENSLTNKAIIVNSVGEVSIEVNSIKFTSRRLTFYAKVGYIWFTIASLLAVFFFIIDLTYKH